MSSHTNFDPSNPSMPAGSHEMRDYYPQEPARISPHTAPSITPYLGLRARLSQVGINRWTVLLFLVLVRVLLAITSINNDLDSARREALSACSSVESLGSAMASLPYYMSQGVNELAANGVEKAVNGLADMTTLAVTGVEELVVFYIDMLTSTYLCLITFAVGGSLHSAIQLIESAQGALNSSIKSIAGDFSTAATSFDNTYNSFLADISKGIDSILGSTGTPPQLNLQGPLQSLNNLALPSNLDQNLQQLNNSIPDFSQVQNFTNNAIRYPFEEVKSLIAQHLGNYTFDSSVFPVPQKEELTFCSDNNGINNFFDDLDALVGMARKIFIGVLLAGAVLACVPMAWLEIRRWRTMQERSQLVRSSAHDPMDVVYIISRPYTSTAGIKLADKFQSPRRQTLLRWVIAYATTPAMLFILSLALAGLFSCACQAILLKSLEREVPSLTNEVSAFADTVIAALNNASDNWAQGTNAAIASVNEDINQQMLGWVNITTGALNTTLNVFVNDTMALLNETFGGTVLYEPVVGVLDCLVLLKVKGIEKGLTWISDNAYVDFPTFPNNTFTVGAAASIASGNADPSNSFLSAPGDDATDQISAAVERFTSRLESAIRSEALISASVLLVWLVLVLAAIARASFQWLGRDKTRGEGGAAPSMAQTRHDTAVTTQADFRAGPLPHDMTSHATPAPEYHAHMMTATNGYASGGVAPPPQQHQQPPQEPFYGFSDDYEELHDQKRGGYAGERRAAETRPGARSRQSSHAHVYDGDVKR